MWRAPRAPFASNKGGAITFHGSVVLALTLGEPTGQGWTQIVEILTALVLSSLIGLERELGKKNAGLRTHALVGVGAALFMLVSKYGFTDVLVPGKVILDPSRVAAQIVTGIGFIGGGLIFVRRDAVQGLTTAAVVWVTAAIGAACGAGLPVLAAVVTGCHFLVVQGYPLLKRRIGVSIFSVLTVHVRYTDGRGLLRTILALVTSQGFVVSEIATNADSDGKESLRDTVGESHAHDGIVGVTIQLQGSSTFHELAAVLTEIEGVHSVVAEGIDDASE
jgi:putative Mg2+ transporter-C (MgtC) family protein